MKIYKCGNQKFNKLVKEQIKHTRREIWGMRKQKEIAQKAAQMHKEIEKTRIKKKKIRVGGHY